MKGFIIKTALFLFPFLSMVCGAILLDPFKVWFDYDDYSSPIVGNGENISLKLYDKGKGKHQFNSFIFGSSRSHAYKTHEWKKYLSHSDSPFLFSASGEGIYGIYNKLRYLDEQNASIDNVLLILDEGSLTTNFNRQGHLFISPPALSRESTIEFYKTFIVASLDREFLWAYLKYKAFGNYTPSIIRESEFRIGAYGDVYYLSYEDSIKRDSMAYYSAKIKQGVFYNRMDRAQKQSPKISDIEKLHCSSIASILKKHNSKLKIVISPLYSQIPISAERIAFLESIFGKENVFNFSGRNGFTESIGNYYEDSHYRPHVAREILKIIYQ